MSLHPQACAAVLLMAMCTGCDTSGTKTLAEQIGKAQSLARSSEGRFVAIENAAQASPPEIDFIVQSCVDGAHEQRLIQGSGAEMSKALTTVRDNESTLDKIWGIVKTLSMWGIIAVVAFLLATTAAGPVIFGFVRGLFQKVGLLIPRSDAIRAKFDAERIESAAATPPEREAVAAHRASDKAYDAAYTAAQQALRAKGGGP